MRPNLRRGGKSGCVFIVGAEDASSCLNRRSMTGGLKAKRTLVVQIALVG
jgi:hypothetical protein